MEAKILLGGGGSAEDERPIMELFASWVGASGSVLYLPIALGESGQGYARCLTWLSSVLNPLGVHQIELSMLDRDPQNAEVGLTQTDHFNERRKKL